jgi:hypothetical protein
MVTELEEEGCYAAKAEDHELAGWQPDAAVKVAGAAKIIRLPNDVAIHGPEGSPNVSALFRVCEDFPEVWSKAISTIDIPSEN